MMNKDDSVVVVEPATISKTNQESDDKRTNFRWVIVGLLLASAAISYLDRVCMGVAAPKIQEEFGLTNTEIGMIIGLFQWGYVAAYIPAGVMVDRIGARRGFPLIVGFGLIAGALTAFSSRFWHFITLRFLLGLGEAGNWPTSNKVVAEWFPKRERPLACGLFNGGATIGMILGPPVIAAIVLHWSWRYSFIVGALINVVWIVFWLLIYQSPEKHARVNAAELAYIRGEEAEPQREAAASGTEPALTWQRLLRYPEVWGVLILNASSATTWFVLFNWLPKYFYDVRGINFELLGWYVAMPMVGGAIGNLGGGWFLGWLISRPTMTVTKARRVVIFASVAMMTCLIPAAYVDNLLISVLLMAVVAFGYSTHSANVLSSISDFVDRDLVATLTGIQATGTFLLTLPLVTYAGWVIDKFGYTTLLVVAGLLPWLSIVAAYTLIRRFGPLRVEPPVNPPRFPATSPC